MAIIPQKIQQKQVDQKVESQEIREEGQDGFIGSGLEAIYDRDEGQGGKGQQGQDQAGDDEFLAYQLADKIAHADSGKIKSWAGKIAKAQEQLRIPAGDPRMYIGSYAAAATYEPGSQFDAGHRKLFANAPWRVGVDGANLPGSGKPLVVEGAPYSEVAFDSNSTDIPDEWVSQMNGEMSNSRVNQDFQANRQLLAMGRYSMLRA